MSSRPRRGAAKAPPRRGSYRLEFLESALREWSALDGSVKVLFKKLLARRLEDPHVPGPELHGPLSGCYKIQLRAQGYRLVYQVRDDVLAVLVIAIDRRDKDRVYQAALKRVADMVARASAEEGSPTRKARR